MTAIQLELFATQARSPGIGHRRNPARQSTHIIVEPLDSTALCGTRDPLPHVLARFAHGYIIGWRMPMCPACVDSTLAAALPEQLCPHCLAGPGRWAGEYDRCYGCMANELGIDIHRDPVYYFGIPAHMLTRFLATRTPT
jgi:hypothetical protein